ncbi:MAG: hypothetical protein SGARI_004848 [Bacillariaceae sp.]
MSANNEQPPQTPVCQETSPSRQTEEKPVAADVETSSPEKKEDDAEEQPAAPLPVKKKKKKKASYKNMMANMMTGNEKKDMEKEREAIGKGLGGGAFSKIEKI